MSKVCLVEFAWWDFPFALALTEPPITSCKVHKKETSSKHLIKSEVKEKDGNGNMKLSLSEVWPLRLTAVTGDSRFKRLIRPVQR